MYVAVKGGERAIANAHALLAEERRGDTEIPELSVAQIRSQMRGAVDRVMVEGSLYDRDLAALAIKQAQGDLIEAVFLLRAFRTTLPRFASTLPVDTMAMDVRRRISSTFKDVPGGQILGPTYDYTHRLLDFSLTGDATQISPAREGEPSAQKFPSVVSMMAAEGLFEQDEVETDSRAVGDLTREPLTFPARRDVRLQNLARGDEGFVLALGYASQRGYGDGHPFAAEIRMGGVEVEILPEELGFPVCIGEIILTECQMVAKFDGSAERPAQFTRGYGLTFGFQERKAMSMSMVDRALRSEELGEEIKGPLQDQEFVLSHSDNVESSGFVEHLKLPHYVDFQAEMEMVRSLRASRTHKEEGKENE